MNSLIMLVPILLGLVGLALVIGALIGLWAARPDDSTLRRTIDRNLVRGNLPKDPKTQLGAGIALLALAAWLSWCLLAGDALRIRK
jgi:heme O synthase-like polyprenyltransferase